MDQPKRTKPLMTATEQRVLKVNAGRYDLGPYQIVRAHWNSWEIWLGRELGCRVNSLIDVRPTKRAAVAAVRESLHLEAKLAAERSKRSCCDQPSGPS